MKNVDIPKWLERLPLAPEFRPTDTEFADPIAYISKIEKEASAFGICKVIPPLPKPSRKYVLHNLNKSLSKCPELGLDVNLVTSSKTDYGAGDNCDRTVSGGESRAVFTTRHQELGCEKGKKVKGTIGDQVVGAQKQVWQSGEVYTLEQFEVKSKNFAKSQLGTVKEVNPLVIEAMFWKAASEKPIYVEYANDVPGTGFGEPEGLLQYFDRRRRRTRKRNSFDRNNLRNSDNKSDQVDKENSVRGSSFCTKTASKPLPSGQSHNAASFSGRKDFHRSGEMEGTAGWKLSNSPWNLQVIARSPGSLTRFMPDDIPGVTSPMVYIGMLFSWFAWHVEDHELHSLNFLHIGSPKTWYAVPGDYALNFEEIIRLHAYGENADRMVSLSLLGEKTTVLSPEVIAASGIPCCRLVQNPGEFVVTFPRAYHIGFSHGFNCGEAANFGTPKWLTIAKEAAVRRAAMNYLPMLSHQQLLYLLTMSFISRIPRSLLPGVRSSRLRDRQKEEREILVKRAFIEDILHENSLVTVLLQRSSSYHAVLWDIESMPSSSKESEICNDADAVVLTTESGKDSPVKDNIIHDVNQLSKYISAASFDLNDDDLAYDFQIESGTLPCVACGILGFPFMAVIQPSEVASTNLQLTDPLTVSVESGLLSDLCHVVQPSTKDAMDRAKSNKEDLDHVMEASSVVETSLEQSKVPNHRSSSKHEDVSSKVKIAEGWNVSHVSLKPRIFCLEHAIQIEELLSSKGGANVLVICHSDFQKINTHAAVVAEEIAMAFCYTEIPLDNASLEDLNLIDIAIGRDEQVECAEDWTSQMSINLQHCVKVKKSSPSKDVQHLLSLSGLSCDATPILNTSIMKWLSRKLRTKRRHLWRSKSSHDNEIREDIGTKKEDQMAKKDVKIIQYSRKRYKARTTAGLQVPIDTNKLVEREILGTDTEDPHKEDKIMSRSIVIRVKNNGKSFSGPSALPSDELSDSQCEHSMVSSCSSHVDNSFPSHHADSVIASTPMIENVEAETRICPLKDNMGGSCSENVGLTLAENEIECAAENETLRKEETMDKSAASKTYDQQAEHHCEMPENIHSDVYDVIKEASRCGGSSNCSDDDRPPSRCDEQMEAISDPLVMDNQVSKLLDSKGHVHIQTNRDDKEEVISRYSTPSLIEEHLLGETNLAMGSHNNDGQNMPLPEKNILDDSKTTAKSKTIAKSGSKRRREAVLQSEDQFHVDGFIRSPCERLRPRAREDASSCVTDNIKPVETPTLKKSRKARDHSIPCKDKKEHQKGCHKCELDGCKMSFQTKAELVLHKGNRCPVEGCRKKFNSHKYAIQHQRVHDDDRPLKCPWNGCAMSFKWAWARTEHLRVHTGERPYVCKVKGCGLTFRFVSDFSRHRRKTGHYVSPPA